MRRDDNMNGKDFHVIPTQSKASIYLFYFFSVCLTNSFKVIQSIPLKNKFNR